MSRLWFCDKGHDDHNDSHGSCSSSPGRHGWYPKVSLVVPVYNLGHFVAPCLKSLVRQSYRNLEIIVVDDGCTDSTPEICRDVLKDDSRAVLLHKTNGGLSSARNFGLARATGEFAMLVDGDDVLDRGAVEHLVSLARETGVKLVTCGYEKIASANDFVCNEAGGFKVVSGEELLKMMLLSKGESGSAWAKLYERELFPLLVFPEGQLFEDFGVEAGVFSHIDKVCVSNAKLYGYVAREGSITAMKRYGDAHLEGMKSSLEVVKAIVAANPDLKDAFSSFEAFCLLRVASRLDLDMCRDKDAVIECVQMARDSCRLAVRNPLVGRAWRIRCALFSISPCLHNVAYYLYGKLTGKVIV